MSQMIAWPFSNDDDLTVPEIQAELPSEANVQAGNEVRIELGTESKFTKRLNEGSYWSLFINTVTFATSVLLNSSSNFLARLCASAE